MTVEERNEEMLQQLTREWHSTFELGGRDASHHSHTLARLVLATMYSGLGFFCTAVAVVESRQGDVIPMLIGAGGAIWFAKELIFLPMPNGKGL